MDETTELESRYESPAVKDDPFDDQADYNFIVSSGADDVFRSRMTSGNEAADPAAEQSDYGVSFQLTGTDTVSGFAWNGQKALVQDMKACVARGDVAAAKEIYDRISATVDANTTTLSEFVNLADPNQQAGPVAGQLAERSAYFLFGQYNQEKVVSPDGTETTIGQLLSNPAQFQQDRSAELTRAGFNEAAVDLFMKDDPAAKTIMNDLVRSKTALPNVSALRDFANVYANNHQRITETFGEGTEQFVRDIVGQHRMSGSAVDTLDTLLEYAEAYKQRTGKGGRVLAREVFGGYRNLLAASFKGVEKFDSHGVAMPLQVTENQQRQFSAAFGPAVRETLKQLPPDVGFDLYNPQFRRAFMETQDCLAYVSAAAGDMFAESRRAGYDINHAFGQYIADAVAGKAPRGENIVTAINAMRSDLSARLTGGHDARRVATELTGRSSDYLTSMKQNTGFESDCPAADTIANDVHQCFVRTMLPYVARGSQWGKAITKPGVQQQLVRSLTDRISRSFFGTARQEVAGALASSIVSRYAAGEEVCISELVSDLAFGPPSARLSQSARRTVRSWHGGNVVDPLRFAKEKQLYKQQLMSEGYTEPQANVAVARVSEMAEQDRRAGRNSKATWDTAFATGVYWEPVYRFDEKNAYVLDGNGQPVVADVRQAFGDRRKVSLLVGGVQYPAGFFQTHPDAWNAMQKALGEEKDRRIRAQVLKDTLQTRQQYD